MMSRQWFVSGPGLGVVGRFGLLEPLVGLPVIQCYLLYSALSGSYLGILGFALGVGWLLLTGMIGS